jgi:hypothetical protein
MEIYKKGANSRRTKYPVQLAETPEAVFLLVNHSLKSRRTITIKYLLYDLKASLARHCLALDSSPFNLVFNFLFRQ